MKLRRYLLVVLSPETEDRLARMIDEALDSHLDTTDVRDFQLLSEEEVDYPGPPLAEDKYFESDEVADAFDAWLDGAQALVGLNLPDPIPPLEE